MKLKKLMILTTAATFLLGGCKFDDGDLWNELNNQKERLTKLEQKVETLNTDIQSIRAIVEALQSKDMITGVTETADGYTINFVTHAPITIKHGQKGADGTNGTNGTDGTTPVISVTEEGGVYYWTVNGEPMKDASGNKLPVTGKDGADGSDGENGLDGQNAVAPQVRVDGTTFEWEISTDGGTTWTSTGVVAQGQNGTNGTNGTDGADGDSFFSGVDTTDPAFVVFTLADGTTTFTIPRYVAADPLALAFTNLRGEVFEVVVNQAPKALAYTHTGTIAKIGIASALPRGWRWESDASNQLLVSSSRVGEAQALVVATAADGTSVSYWVTLSALASEPVSVNSIPELEAALAAASDGDIIDLEAGTYTTSGSLIRNKNITLRAIDTESTIIETGGTHPAIKVNSAVVTIDGITIASTNAATNIALITLTGNVDNSIIKNCVFEGTYDLSGGDPQVIRGILADAGRSLTITGNRFINVRQPAYIQGPATITGNYTEGTRGWVITQDAIVDMTGNTFGTNAVDIAIIQNAISTDLVNYDDARILELHTLNGGAHVENQVTSGGAPTSVYNSVRKDGTTYNWPN